MPDKWYNWIANKLSKANTSSEKKEYWFNRRLLADKKPYFMQYIYPKERVLLNDYIKKNDEKCFMRFRMSLENLISKKNKSKEEQKFIDCYYRRFPVGMSPCTINKICWKIEELFDLDTSFNQDNKFDYSILKCNIGYSKQLYNKIKTIYDRYRKELSNYMQIAKSERIKSENRQIQKYLLKEQFKRRCLEQCPNEEILCDIMVDLCYSKSKNSKQFAWDICGDVFIQNLLRRKNYMVSYPALDDAGDIEFDGKRFSMKTSKIKVRIDLEDDECQLY